MTMSLSPQEIQELAAGYVLGDLDSDEAELFQALLAELPELGQEVVTLQEALAVMPYGLAEVEVDTGVRSQLLTRAEAELQANLTTDPIALGVTEFGKQETTPAKVFQPRSQRRWVMGSVAAGFAIVCGLVAVRLNGQMRFQQAQSEQTPDQISVAQTWAGLDDILQDHQKSLDNPDGPVDFVIRQASDIPSQVPEFATTVAALPLLPQGQLLGASKCQFGETSGLRLTYQLSADQTVSAYQLQVSDQSLPELASAMITLQQSDGTGLVLWRDDHHLYALVAALPIPELQALAHAINDS
ncbi:MAG: hypothetical protein F6K00_06740 [Leptolyngbya sp. SIOISBB]|nr:hypothetical protein [Leptolyngbya sp. SIOISBB]